MSMFKMGELVPLIQAEAQRQGVDPLLATSIFVAENTADGVLKPEKVISLTTRSPKGAVGVMQTMPATVQGLIQQGFLDAATRLDTLEGQISAGIAAIKEKTKRAGADPLAIAAYYNGGNAGLRGYLAGEQLNPETDNYLAKVGQSLGVTWSGKRLPAGVKDALGSSLSAFEKANARNLPMLQALGLEAEQANQAAKGAITKAGEASATAAELAGQREAQQVSSMDAILQRFGLSSTKEDSILVDQAARMTTAQKQIDQMRPQIENDVSVNPLENPLDFLGAQLRLMGSLPKYNMAVKARDSAATAIAQRQQLAEAQNKLTPAVQLDTITAEARAKAELARASAAAQVAKIDMDNVQARASFLREEMSWMRSGFELNAANARLYAESIGIRRDADAKAEQQKILDNINAVLPALGADPIPTWSQFAARSKSQQELLLELTASAGKSVGKSIVVVKELGTLDRLVLTPGTTAKGEMISKIVRSVEKNVSAAMQMGGKNENAILENEINKKVTSWRKELADGSMDTLPADNPYKMVAATYATAPELKDNEIAKYVQASPVPVETDKQIFTQALGMVKAGLPVHVVAKQVSDFYRHGYKHQFQATGMGSLGFPAEHPKTKATTYTVSTDLFGWWDKVFASRTNTDKPFDATNPTAVENFLVLNTAMGMRRQQAAGADAEDGRNIYRRTLGLE